MEQPLLVAGEPGAILSGDQFSEGWMEAFRSGERGVCKKAVDVYRWRNSGWGNNVNGEMYPELISRSILVHVVTSTIPMQFIYVMRLFNLWQGGCMTGLFMASNGFLIPLL